MYCSSYSGGIPKYSLKPCLMTFFTVRESLISTYYLGQTKRCQQLLWSIILLNVN